MLAAIISTAALAIDLMLPAFDDMRATFGLEPDSTQVARAVTAFFLGLASAQIIYGPLADRFGRKPVLFAALAINAAGGIGSALAPSLELLLLSRFVWGVGAAGSRVIAVALVRDRYEGDQMARAMSLIMGILIVVPIFAPGLGAVIIHFSPWRSVFWACVIVVAAVALWVRRLPETLDPADRLELSWHVVLSAMRRVFKTQSVAGHIVAMTFLIGAFTSYLASSELIISDIFDREDQFPIIFGATSLVIGLASFANAALVEQVGVRRMVSFALVAYVAGGGLLTLVAINSDGKPNFLVFVALVAFTLSAHIVLMPSLNTLALARLGDIAGTASATVGAVSWIGGALLGALIDSRISGSVTPFAVGMLLAGCGASAAVGWTARVSRSVVSPR